MYKLHLQGEKEPAHEESGRVPRAERIAVAKSLKLGQAGSCNGLKEGHVPDCSNTINIR